MIAEHKLQNWLGFQKLALAQRKGCAEKGHNFVDHFKGFLINKINQ